MNKFANIMTPFQANAIKHEIYSNPHSLQEETFKYLLSTASKTKFGEDHNFAGIKDYDSFKSNVPVRDYHDFSFYWDLMFKGENDVIWPGKPDFLLTTSASTGVPKYIPANQQSITNALSGFLKSVMQYIYDTEDEALFNHYFMNLTGTPILGEHCGYPAGTMSGVMRLNLKSELSALSLPSTETIDLMRTKSWSAMFEAAAKEAFEKKISVCSGLPSWIVQFFNICCDLGKTSNLSELLPELRLITTAGVNYRPYLPQIEELFDNEIAIRELYGASEGCFAYQDSSKDNGMLLDLTTGNYYEFIELEKPENRVNLSGVKPGVKYILVISNCAGLWGYRMGDIIQFTNTEPYRLEIIGRTKHYISLLSEHVYSKNVEMAIQELNNKLKIDINNFTVTRNPVEEKSVPYYCWYIETPQHHGLNLKSLAEKLDSALRNNSHSYDCARKMELLSMPKVALLEPGAFLHYLSLKDKTSLQLKVPKVSNSREIAEFLIENKLVVEQEAHVA